MPTYDYACGACGHEFELEQRITAPPAKKCPKCGKNKAARQISAGNFILKGGGWYADGYGASKKSAAKKEPTATTPSCTSPSTAATTSSTDSKSDTKTEKPKAAAAE